MSTALVKDEKQIHVQIVAFIASFIWQDIVLYRTTGGFTVVCLTHPWQSRQFFNPPSSLVSTGKKVSRSKFYIYIWQTNKCFEKHIELFKDFISNSSHGFTLFPPLWLASFIFVYIFMVQSIYLGNWYSVLMHQDWWVQESNSCCNHW